MATPVPSAEMLDAFSQCAYRLGMAFGAEAERTQGKAMLEACERFERCFFSVRMAIGLQLRLRQPMPVQRAAESERERAERDPSDHHTRADPIERERERERETERASAPLLLKTLETVTADAALLPGPVPAALLTLRELLAKFSSTPAHSPVPTATPPPRPTGDVRTRLAATTSTSVLTAAPLRRATGPPGR